MNNSKHAANNFQNNAVSGGQALETLTLDDADQVGGGCLPLIILCVACALLLAHD